MRHQPTRAETSRIEGAFDALFEAVPLPAASRSDAIWHLVNVVEDVLRIVIAHSGDHSVVFGQFNRMPFAYHRALALILRKTVPALERGDLPRFDEEAYSAAMLLIDAAATYDSIVRTFMQYQRRRRGLRLDSSDRLLPPRLVGVRDH